MDCAPVQSVQIILFGSWARGEAKDSDFDLLAFTKGGT
jgi:predicted nucleotidyltransferase